MGSSERRSRPVCMLVEDEALIALALEDELAEAGYEIAGPFASCADALASLAERVPDVAILDATLKDGSCQEVARELRRLDVPFMLYSGRQAVERNHPDFEGAPWVEKPAMPNMVLRAVMKLARPLPAA